MEYHGDPLTIYDGPNNQSTQIEKLSGNLGSFGISSTRNFLFVIFVSDEWMWDCTIYGIVSLLYDLT